MIIDNLLIIAVIVFVLMVIGVALTFKECHYDEHQPETKDNDEDQRSL